MKIHQSNTEYLLTVMVISTSSVWYQIWKVFIIILSFSSSFHYAFMAAFDSTEEGNHSLKTNYFELSYEFLFGVDMVLNFFAEFHQ